MVKLKPLTDSISVTCNGVQNPWNKLSNDDFWTTFRTLLAEISLFKLTTQSSGHLFFTGRIISSLCGVLDSRKERYASGRGSVQFFFHFSKCSVLTVLLWLDFSGKLHRGFRFFGYLLSIKRVCYLRFFCQWLTILWVDMELQIAETDIDPKRSTHFPYRLQS